MIVIEHETTKERYSYPSHNVNKETYDGFLQFQVVPVGFIISEDQTPTEQTYLHSSGVYLIRLAADIHDPLNTINKWELMK